MPKGQARVLESIMDAEIANAKHVASVVERLDVSKERLRLLARRVYLLRQKDKLTRVEARKMFIKGFVALLLAEYAHDIPKLKSMTDAHLERQYEAVKKLEVRLSTLPAIKGKDITARALAGRA